MNFNLGKSNFTFPEAEVKLDTHYEDDDFKLHSDLVGVDFNNYLENTNNRCSSSSGGGGNKVNPEDLWTKNSGGGAAATAGFVDAATTTTAAAAGRPQLDRSSEEAAEILHMSLPLYDPRKTNKKSMKQRQVKNKPR